MRVIRTKTPEDPWSFGSPCGRCQGTGYAPVLVAGYEPGLCPICKGEGVCRAVGDGSQPRPFTGAFADGRSQPTLNSGGIQVTGASRKRSR